MPLPRCEGSNLSPMRAFTNIRKGKYAFDILMLFIHNVNPPRPRGGLLNFPIHSKPVGLEIFKNQGGVDIAGWG